MTAVVIAVLLVPVAVAYVSYRQMTRRHGLPALIWRWLSGMPLDGKHRTDATWLHPSSKTLHPTPVVAWHHWPRLYRAGVRDLITVAPAVYLWAYIRATHATLAVTWDLLFAFAGVAVWAAWQLVALWNHRRKWVRPTRRAVTAELGAPPPKLAIAADRSEVTLWLPHELTSEDAKRAITRAVETKLAIEAPEPAWKLYGKKPHVVFTRSEPPPASVWLPDILPAVKAAAEHEIVLGLGKHRDVITISLDVDTPHAGLCMKSGRGKSKAAGNAAAQILYHGGNVLFIDWKLTSHQWARGLPNVAYAGTAAEIHEALCWLTCDDTDEDGNVIRQCELTRRKNVVLATANLAGEVPAGVDVGARLLVVAEELNALQAKLKKLWRQMGGKGPSPAAEGLDELLFTGREFRIHVLQIGQRLSAKATSGSGSADSRENLGAILFSNPSNSTWDLLTDKAPKPPASDHPGRHQLFANDTVREMQGVLYHRDKLTAARMMRELAMAGTVTPAPWDMPFVVRPAGVVPAGVGQNGTRTMVASDQGIDVEQMTALPPSRPPGTVTLREAVNAGIFTSVPAARKMAQRYKPEPAGSDGAALLYNISDLANLPRRGKVTVRDQ